MTIHHIFTALSSVSGENASKIIYRLRDVATNLGLDGHVTPQSIAYTVLQHRYVMLMLITTTSGTIDIRRFLYSLSFP